ncbi:MAG TPA: CSLREA domain-containing protein, partial [Xanthomonadales bacterium]|nr:CSLREA domain-containing protein [Xanthomonadales bacterium]
MFRHLNLTCHAVFLAVIVLMPAGARAVSTIYVTTTAQEVNTDASCSLQEAIYAANLDSNQAPDIFNPGQFITTGCTAGSGADIIELPPDALFIYSDPI